MASTFWPFSFHSSLSEIRTEGLESRLPMAANTRKKLWRSLIFWKTRKRGRSVANSQAFSRADMRTKRYALCLLSRFWFVPFFINRMKILFVTDHVACGNIASSRKLRCACVTWNVKHVCKFKNESMLLKVERDCWVAVWIFTKWWENWLKLYVYVYFELNVELPARLKSFIIAIDGFL